ILRKAAAFFAQEPVALTRRAGSRVRFPEDAGCVPGSVAMFVRRAARENVRAAFGMARAGPRDSQQVARLSSRILCTMQIKLHSRRTFESPRKENERTPKISLM